MAVVQSLQEEMDAQGRDGYSRKICMTTSTWYRPIIISAAETPNAADDRRILPSNVKRQSLIHVGSSEREMTKPM